MNGCMSYRRPEFTEECSEHNGNSIFTFLLSKLGTINWAFIDFCSYSPCSGSCAPLPQWHHVFWRGWPRGCLACFRFGCQMRWVHKSRCSSLPMLITLHTQNISYKTQRKLSELPACLLLRQASCTWSGSRQREKKRKERYKECEKLRKRE